MKDCSDIMTLHELKKDKERLDWLISNYATIETWDARGSRKSSTYRVEWQGDHTSQDIWHESPRKAIDIAMKAKS